MESGLERIAAIKAKNEAEATSNKVDAKFKDLPKPNTGAAYLDADQNAAAFTNKDVKDVAKLSETAQEINPDWKVFIDDNGLMYRALVAKFPSHASKPLATRDMLEVLTDEPCSQEHMVGKIIELGNKRTAAVLEPIPNVIKGV